MALKTTAASAEKRIFSSGTMPSEMENSVITTVDVVLLTWHEEQLKVALFKRAAKPFAGKPALPGVYIQSKPFVREEAGRKTRLPGDINVRAAAVRALSTKTGIVSPYLEQLWTFSGPDRDPRGWSLSVAHYALVPPSLLEGANIGAMELRPVDVLGELAFDHAEIIATAVARLRRTGGYSSLPIHLAGEKFTKPYLQKIYEKVCGIKRDKVSFLRRLDELDVLEEIPGEKEQGVPNKPAQLYRLKASAKAELALLERGL